jgi:hypothetical protein
LPKRCQMMTKLPRFLYGEFEGCPNEAKHSIVSRIKRDDVLTDEKRTIRVCDEHYNDAKTHREKYFIGDPNPEFRENQL